MNTTRSSILLGLFLAGSLANAADEAPRANAALMLSALRDSVRIAHANKDTVGYLQGARALYTFLNGSPRATLQLMAAQSYAGKQDDALESFKQFVRMGQSDPDALRGEAFAQLRLTQGFAAVAGSMDGNDAPRGRAKQFLSLKRQAAVPEDIDYDAKSERFFISSVVGKNVVTLTSAGLMQVFAKSPDGWPMMALKIDRAKRRLWVTEMAVGLGKSAVLLYELDNGTLLKKIPGPPKTEFGDMILNEAGNALIADGSGGGIYEVDAESGVFTRLDAGDFISPQTPACGTDCRHLFVPDYLRGIAMLDVASRKVTWLASEGRYALAGIDGLYLFQHTLIATQNGASPERVVRFELDPSLSKITAEAVIERATPSLGDPTHGVIVDGDFYYLANSGWETLDDHGHRKAGQTIKPALLMRARLN
jgi:hypothetical protein